MTHPLTDAERQQLDLALAASVRGKHNIRAFVEQIASRGLTIVPSSEVERLRERVKEAEVSNARLRSNYSDAVRSVQTLETHIAEALGPDGSMDGPDAVLLRGPEVGHSCEAIAEAVSRAVTSLRDRASSAGQYAEQITNLTTKLASVEAERDRLREALEKIAATQEMTDALGLAYDAPVCSAEEAQEIAREALALLGGKGE